MSRTVTQIRAPLRHAVTGLLSQPPEQADRRGECMTAAPVYLLAVGQNSQLAGQPRLPLVKAFFAQRERAAGPLPVTIRVYF